MTKGVIKTSKVKLEPRRDISKTKENRSSSRRSRSARRDRSSRRSRRSKSPVRLSKKPTLVLKSRAEASQSGYKVRVSNLPTGSSADEVKTVFTAVGKIIDVTVLGQSATIEFRRREDAELAVKKYDQGEVNGRRIQVRSLNL